jgi:hypothetical protein
MGRMQDDEARQKAMRDRENEERRNHVISMAILIPVILLLVFVMPKACGEPGAHFGGGDWCDENNCH